MQVVSLLWLVGKKKKKKTNYNDFAPRGVQRNLEGLIEPCAEL